MPKLKPRDSKRRKNVKRNGEANPVGHPIYKYKPEYAETAKAMCELGATDRDLAALFHVSIVSIWNWQAAHPEFFEALKRGKEAADERVERSLYMRAVGYSYESEKIFCNEGIVTRVPYVEHVAPDPTSCIFWLKNRRASEWRDVHKIDHAHAHRLDLHGGAMTIEQAQEMFRAVRTMPIEELEKQLKFVDGRVVMANEDDAK